MQKLEMSNIVNGNEEKRVRVDFDGELLHIDVVYILPCMREVDNITLNFDETKELYLFLKELFENEADI